MQCAELRYMLNHKGKPRSDAQEVLSPIVLTERIIVKTKCDYFIIPQKQSPGSVLLRCS